MRSMVEGAFQSTLFQLGFLAPSKGERWFAQQTGERVFTSLTSITESTPCPA